MASMLSSSVVVAVPRVKEDETSEGLTMARQRTLEELPGLVFGVMTICWIVFSMAKLVF